MISKSRFETIDRLRPEKGTYIIIIKVDTIQKIEIGKIGKFTFEKGYYIYNGSAHGPGGIKARIKRHLKKNKAKKHWHIDYLRNRASVDAIMVSYSKKKKECEWASKLSSSPSLSIPVNGFGSSDCSCPSHLFYCGADFNLESIKKIVKDPVEYFKLPFTFLSRRKRQLSLILLTLSGMSNSLLNHF
ncbi:MAG: GIY-YIG nuclease family protein [Desulfobacteraceae bacterium]|jgi:Uri superfamily endonuclease